MKRILIGLIGLIGCQDIDKKTEKSWHEFKKLGIEYKKDIEVHGVADYWQTPEETKKLKTGDCEDQSLLLEDMLKKNGVNECRFVCGELELNKKNYHCWVECRENHRTYVLEPTNGKYYEKKMLSDNLYEIMNNPNWDWKRAEVERRRNER